MAHNNFSEKLDQISAGDLGFSFDEDASWIKLEARLNKKSFILERRWLAAACLFIAILTIPFTLLKESSHSVSDRMVMESHEIEIVEKPTQIVVPVYEGTKRFERTPITIEPKKIELSIAEIDFRPIIPLKKVEVKAGDTSTPQFAAEDISIIQASLEGARVEKGKNLSIRAQWQTSPNEVNVDYQALKIKLYEKEKKH
ncbi:MAG: hypothetical protein RLN88_14575 [Ekhidna sp.]|uniref:hypothetical protein n=1 Tax=Ekhidna sp. TaxID=2608089 RepID=UPI0032F07AD1